MFPDHARKIPQSICNPLFLPDYNPGIKNAITKTRSYPELGNSQFIGEDYTCNIDNGSDQVVISSPNQFRARSSQAIYLDYESRNSTWRFILNILEIVTADFQVAENNVKKPGVYLRVQ